MRLKGARGIYDRLEDVNRRLALNKRERAKLLEEKRRIIEELGQCEVELTE